MKAPERHYPGVEMSGRIVKAGDRVRVIGRVIDFQTESLEIGEAKPLTRVLIEYDEIESDEERQP